VVKIKHIEINGLRGIKKTISVSLDSSQSILIFGENGSGKSSITDAFEWFYNDKVEHLSSEEIGRGGIEALRNIFLQPDQEAYAGLKFSESKYNSIKKLFYNKSKLSTEIDNSTKEFEDYINSSTSENLILRYGDLLKFILASKGDKLRGISQIIGYEEVQKIKEIFKRAVNDVKREIKLKNFEGQTSNRQTQMLTQTEQMIVDDRGYFDAIKRLVEPLNLSAEIMSHENIESVLKTIEQPENRELLALYLSFETTLSKLDNFIILVEKTKKSYNKFIEKYQKIIEDSEKLKKINLEKLISEGINVLERSLFNENKCPLCLQVKNRDELISELRQRIDELKHIKNEKEETEKDRQLTKRLIQDIINELASILKEKCINIQENIVIKEEIQKVLKDVLAESEEIEKYDYSKEIQIKSIDKFLLYDEIKLAEIKRIIDEQIKQKTAEKKEDVRFSISKKIALTRQAYFDYLILRKESEILQQQIESLGIIYNHFIKKQKEALGLFLKTISKDTNDFYIYMNNNEAIDEIQLIPMGEEDELIGLTIQFKFHEKTVTPPNKYLSESHLNCLGICLFLSSIKAFNKLNKFFILDDEASSFDIPHRIRFAQLLLDKFEDYQIFLFTHDQDWFEYLSNFIKGKNWITKRIFWDNENGTEMEEPLLDLKSRIKNKFSNSDPTDLGNMIRRYLEGLLKDISYNLGVKVEFRYNDLNENRMSNELLSELRHKLIT